tara:strand:- start:87 stop:356 length:270 start_codon:yes stop_codon:yes gene_type:complete
VKYFVLFLWVELVCLFAFGCVGPKERRGDWMEHLNYRQFSSEPLDLNRHKNYYTIEELKVMWGEAYQEAIEDIPDAAIRMLDRKKGLDK